jgi:outer membrane cobalamin receptor
MRLFVFRFFRALFFVALLSLPGVSAAQSAALSGHVSDPSGAAVSGAAIEISAADNAAQPSHATTDADGAFSVNLPAGRYDLWITAPNFAAEHEAVSVTASGETLDIRLQLALASSRVIVAAEAVPAAVDAVVVPADVITREQIVQQGQPWLLPILATVPGVAFSQLGAEGGVTSLFLDGGNSNYTRVMLDGIPVDVSLPGLSIDLSNATTDAIDKIEVVHGAASALYGSDAMTGVVAILTHRGATRTPLLELEGEGGTFDTGRGGGQLSGILGRFDYSTAVGYFSTRGQSPGSEVLALFGPQTYPFFRDTTLSGNFGWKFSNTNTLRLTVRNNASDAGQPGEIAFPTAPFAVTAGEDGVLHDFATGASWDFSLNNRWENHVQGWDSRMQYEIPLFSLVDKFNRAGFDARSTYLFSNGAGVTAGYSFENETGGALGRHDHAGYLEIRYPITQRLTAVAGGRLEANDSYGTRAVPRVGAAYALRDGSGVLGATRLRASFGQGIKEPPLNPDDCEPILKPEQSTTFDAGLDQNFDQNRVRLSANFFHNDFHNIVSFASGAMPNNQPQNCPAFFGSYFNTDKARAYGVDSSLEVRASRWVNVRGTYSYDDSRVIKSPFSSDPALLPGNRLLKRPLNSAGLIVNTQVSRINWSIVGYYVGPRTDSDFLGQGLTRNPGYVRWDTATSFALIGGLTFTAHIQNLFDKHYQDALGYPALGYNYRLGLRYVWGGGR